MCLVGWPCFVTFTPLPAAGHQRPLLPMPKYITTSAKTTPIIHCSLHAVVNHLCHRFCCCHENLSVGLARSPGRYFVEVKARRAELFRLQTVRSRFCSPRWRHYCGTYAGSKPCGVYRGMRNRSRRVRGSKGALGIASLFTL